MLVGLEGMAPNGCMLRNFVFTDGVNLSVLHVKKSSVASASSNINVEILMVKRRVIGIDPVRKDNMNVAEIATGDIKSTTMSTG